MSKKLTKSILNRDEISLLLNSEEAKNFQLYGNLYNVLLQIKDLKAISLEELENRNLDYHGRSALSYNKHTLIDNATKEWRATTDIIDNPKRVAICQLCNAPKLRYECHIRNIKNNIELLVGSECVNHFKIDGYINQKKQLAQIHKGHKIVQRRNEFYKRFPDYENTISNAEKYFSTIPILLPYQLYTKLEQVIERMQLIVTKYINEGKKPFNSTFDSFQLFQKAIDQFEKMKQEADFHIKKNKDNSLVCKRPEIDWIISQKNHKLLQEIAEDNGIYSLYTLKNIWFREFVEKNINLILSKNCSKSMIFNKFNGNDIIFSFNKYGYQPSITFSIHLSDFMQKIGANCIMDKSFTYNSKDILSISKIVNTNDNLISILGYIDNIMNLLNCTFLFDDTTKYLYLYRKGDRAIRTFSYYKFILDYSKYISLSDEQIKKYLINLIKGDENVKWDTPQIQSFHGINDKISKLYKNYKSSHEYFHPTSERKFEVVIYRIGNTNTDLVKIDFDSPEFMNLNRNKLNIGDRQLRDIDYALFVSDDSLNPFYKKGNILLIQSVEKVKYKSTIFFISDKSIQIQDCWSENDKYRSIFDFAKLHKKEYIAYGKIVYCLNN